MRPGTDRENKGKMLGVPKSDLCTPRCLFFVICPPAHGRTQIGFVYAPGCLGCCALACCSGFGEDPPPHLYIHIAIYMVLYKVQSVVISRVPSVYIYICIYIQSYIYIYTYIYIHIYIYICSSLSLYIYIYIFPSAPSRRPPPRTFENAREALGGQEQTVLIDFCIFE